MIYHYLTLAFRNLWKYKMQSIISIGGLAVGFACFALSSLWIRYETGYDRSLHAVSRTYLLYSENAFVALGKYSNRNSALAAPALLRAYPEVEAACGYDLRNESRISTLAGRSVTTPHLTADSAFLSINPAAGMAVQGTMDFLRDEGQVALTEQTALALFGTTRVVGDSVLIQEQKRMIGAVLRNVDRHSNLYFGSWSAPERSSSQADAWWHLRLMTLVRLHAGTDVEAFTEKIRGYKVPEGDYHREPFDTTRLIPLMDYHYSEVGNLLPVRFQYLYLFAVTGVLIMVCALLNYLSLFVTRMRTRSREVELRKVCGSSVGDLLMLFGVEYILVLLLSGLVGMSLIELILPAFSRLSGVSGTVYADALLYFVGVLAFAYLCLLPFVLRRTPQKAFRRKLTGNRGSILLQLVICMGFTFCVSVLMLQLNYLSKGDLGWERHNTAVLSYHKPTPEAYESIYQAVCALPMVTETLRDVNPLFLSTSYLRLNFYSWDGKVEDGEEKPLQINVIREGADFARFYNLHLLEGEMLGDDDTDRVLLNQSAVRALGMVDPVGKKMDGAIIAGVLKDFLTLAPTQPVEPTLLCGKHGLLGYRYEGMGTRRGETKVIVMKYREGSGDELRQRIRSINEAMPQEHPYSFRYVEEEYEKFLTSERMLLRILRLAALTCMLIAMFGVFSLVTLSCEQRRKEIAIRKVNGARVADIVALFGRRYLMLVSCAAAIALPVGYVLMKGWLQNYTEQVPLRWWLYALVIAGTAALVACCIGWRVWRTAQINPAETIKSE
ncbi:MAG: ABC transporter permease [Prevotellaceae bacterium]|nr:ABC transporter permease [Prevotellaceae bacterium]